MTRLNIEFDRQISDGHQSNGQFKRFMREGLKIIEDRITRLGIPGKWVIRAHSRAQHRENNQFIVASVAENPYRVLVKAKPGGNDSCWEFHIVPPPGRVTNMAGIQEIADMLKQNEQKSDKHWKPAKADRPVDRPSPVTSLAPNGSGSHDLSISLPVGNSLTPRQNNLPPVLIPSTKHSDYQPTAKNLKSTLSRLQFVLDRADRRQGQIAELAGKIQEIQQQREQLRKTIEARLLEMAATEKTLQGQLERLSAEDASDQNLVQAAEVLSLANEIEFEG